MRRSVKSYTKLKIEYIFGIRFLWNWFIREMPKNKLSLIFGTKIAQGTRPIF